MMKITLAVAAAAVMLTSAPLATPAKAQGIEMAQIDMQTGRHYEDRDPGYYRERRGYDSNATVGVGPGGVTVGPRQRCRMETTTIERDDGRCRRIARLLVSYPLSGKPYPRRPVEDDDSCRDLGDKPEFIEPGYAPDARSS
jgi:hypothetical protein